MGSTLLGSYIARFDRSNRIKIPEKFRITIEEQYGKDLFITSLSDESVQIYPLPIWEKLSGSSMEGTIQLRPSVRSFMIRVNRKGNHYRIDSKGRVLVSQALRENAELNEEVVVLGLSDHLEIWNREKLDTILEKNPLTNEDFENIAALLPQGKIE